MVNEIEYNHVGRTNPDEEAQGRTGFVTNKAGTQQMLWQPPWALFRGAHASYKKKTF